MGVDLTLKKLRKKRGLTLDELAESTGLTRGYLSKIERGVQAPRFTTLEQIARALDVDTSDLLEQNRSKTRRRLDIMRLNERFFSKTEGKDNGYHYAPLVNSFGGKYMSPIVMSLDPGDEKEFSHDSEEFVYIIEGEMILIYEGETVKLNPHDCFYLDSRKKHIFKNESSQKVILLGVSFNYCRF